MWWRSVSGKGRERKRQARSHEILAAHGGKDELRVDDFFVQLLSKEESLSHKIVDHPGVSLGVAVDSGEGGGINDGVRATRAGDLMADIGGHLGVGEAGEVVVDGDTLAEGLMDRLSQGVVEVGLTAEDEGKAVHGVAAEVHEHLDIVEDSSG